MSAAPGAARLEAVQVPAGPESALQPAGVPAAARGWSGVRHLPGRLALAALLVALDLWSKSAVFAWIEAADERGELVVDGCGLGHHRWPLAGEWLTFMLSLNPGAAFGQLHSIPYLLVGGRAAAVVFLIWLLARTPPGRAVHTSALVLVLGGAIGNLYDNLLRARDLALDRYYPPERYPFGPVRDFIDVYFARWSWHFPTFNVADACITVGAILLVAQGVFHRRATA